MKSIFRVLLFSAAFAASAFGGRIISPEIDASAGAAALTLLGGGLLILRSRRKK